jgi:hypothetical protein
MQRTLGAESCSAHKVVQYQLKTQAGGLGSVFHCACVPCCGRYNPTTTWFGTGKQSKPDSAKHKPLFYPFPLFFCLF